MFTVSVLISLAICNANALFNTNSRPSKLFTGDAGDKLLLTPYIESGRIDEARSLSQVKPLKGEITSYTGFLTVDKKCDSNMFFWFFPASNDWQNSSVILWLQGGPGASSLYGLFEEHGPWSLTPSGHVKLRKYSWIESGSVLYIDNPVGTGFSYTSSLDCYSKNQTHVGSNLYEALLQFFTLFHELQAAPFFVTGESYGGKYVPALSYTIHRNNPSAKLKINFQGLAIGNGLVDPRHQFHYSDYLYQLGLIDINTKGVFKQVEEEGKSYIDKKDWNKAFDCFDRLLNGDKLGNQSTLFTNASGFTFYFNYLHSSPVEEGNLEDFLQKTEIRKQIHVGNATWGNGGLVEQELIEDIMQSVLPWLEELLEHYRVLIYNGQLDIIVAYPLTLEYLQIMKWSGAEAYKTAPRMIWYVGNDLAGYVKQAGNLTEVLVRNAGHMVPKDQPRTALYLIAKFIQQ